MEPLLVNKSSSSRALQHLIQVIHTRYFPSWANPFDEHHLNPQWLLPEPNNYYMSLQSASQRRRRSQRGEFNQKRFEADPLQIPNMTEDLLSNLQLLPLQLPVNAAHFPTLPPEIVANILDHLHPFVNPALECSYEWASALWRNAIVKRPCGVFPWLWDLELSEVTAKEASKPTGREWDWELLTCQLAQTDLPEPGQGLPNFPLGLRNRRRIWRLADDILATKPRSVL